MTLTEHFKTEVDSLTFNSPYGWKSASVGWGLHMTIGKDQIIDFEIKILNLWLNREPTEDWDLKVSKVVLEDFTVMIESDLELMNMERPLKPQSVVISGQYITIIF